MEELDTFYRPTVKLTPPDFYPCGCSRLKVEAGLCSIYSSKPPSWWRRLFFRMAHS
jgi:hypothetical protein